MSLVINILIYLSILNHMDCKEQKENTIFQDITQYATIELQHIPIVTVKPKIFKDNPHCPIIQFLGRPEIDRNFDELNHANWTQYQFDNCNVEVCVFNNHNKIINQNHGQHINNESYNQIIIQIQHNTSHHFML